MWLLLSLLVLAPVGWALIGAPAAPHVSAWVDATMPMLASPDAVSTPALLAALIAGIVLGAGRARVATTHVSTVVHEFGHGLAAAALGGRVSRLKMRRDGSGAAHTRLPGTSPVRRFVVAASGYPAPGIVALASVQAVLAGVAALWLAFLVAVLAVMLVLAIRSWWGALLAVALGGVGGAVVALAPATAVVLTVAGLAGLLAGGGVVDAVAQWRARRGGPASDAASMAEQTGLQAGLFAGLHLLLATALAAATLALPVWPQTS
ncbi:MAG: M50 family metallopeptidase [Jiangellales bacterium]